jgi:hypothetical protein
MSASAGPHADEPAEARLPHAHQPGITVAGRFQAATPMVADPERTRRALALTVEPMGNDVFRVVGGAEPHEVRRDPRGRWTCDCQDTRFNPGVSCKHRLARYLASALDARVLEVLRVALG